VPNGYIFHASTSIIEAVINKYSPLITTLFDELVCEKFKLAPARKIKRGAANEEIILNESFTLPLKK
jgi:hypothetical protein